MTQPTSSKQKKPGGQIQNAVTVGSNVAYTVYKSFFSGRVFKHVQSLHLLAVWDPLYTTSTLQHQPAAYTKEYAWPSLTCSFPLCVTALGVISQVVPTHTRDAAFQLFCDLRANTPKDKKFLQRHGQALTPRTNLGWLVSPFYLGLFSIWCLHIEET